MGEKSGWKLGTHIGRVGALIGITIICVIALPAVMVADLLLGRER